MPRKRSPISNIEVVSYLACFGGISSPPFYQRISILKNICFLSSWEMLLYSLGNRYLIPWSLWSNVIALFFLHVSTTTTITVYTLVTLLLRRQEREAGIILLTVVSSVGHHLATPIHTHSFIYTHTHTPEVAYHLRCTQRILFIYLTDNSFHEVRYRDSSHNEHQSHKRALYIFHNSEFWKRLKSIFLLHNICDGGSTARSGRVSYHHYVTRTT